VYEDLVQELVSAQQFSEAFDFAQRAKSRSFLDMLTEARIDPDANLDPQLKQKKKTLLAELGNIQKSIESEYQNEKLDQNKINLLSTERTEMEIEYTNLILDIRKQNPRYADLEHPQPMSFQQAQKLLNDATILLEYFIGESHSFLFSITNDNFNAYNLPGNQKLTGQVLKIRESLQNPTNRHYQNISNILYSELVKPAEDQLNGKSRILVAPDGALNYLPFETLIANNDNIDSRSPIPFLALNFEIHYVPSISVLKALREKTTSTNQKQLIAFANPLLTGVNTKQDRAIVRDWVGTLGPLPNAKREVEEIAKLYSSDDVSIFVGQNASEQNVKTMKLDQYRKIHFASHGLIDEQKPEFSALVLSSDQKSEEDGLLTMREVFDLKLNADVVVLSACKTGLGENIRGEGVSGLSRAFLVAGASAVLVSLWDVYDRTTANFMKALYQKMEQNHMSKTEALKQVRTEMILNSKSTHPYYWAPFILIGEN
ncbi:CHAT domain-containing protein, partial [bacterium]|nr:CHAT domain-containing protein [bacterium]